MCSLIFTDFQAVGAGKVTTESKDDQGSAGPANTDDEDYADGGSGSGYQDEDDGEEDN